MGEKIQKLWGKKLSKQLVLIYILDWGRYGEAGHVDVEPQPHPRARGRGLRGTQQGTRHISLQRPSK